HRCTVPRDRTGTHSTVRARGQADSEADSPRTTDSGPDTPRTPVDKPAKDTRVLPDNADSDADRTRTAPATVRASVHSAVRATGQRRPATCRVPGQCPAGVDTRPALRCADTVRDRKSVV